MSNTDHIKHFGLADADLAQIVRSDGGPDLSNIDFEELELACTQLMQSGEFIRASGASTRVGGLRTRLPGTGIDINIRRALLVSLAIIVDAVHTAGLAMGSLAALGVNMRCWVSLSKTDGELCNRISLEMLRRLGFPITSADILSLTAEKPCRHPAFPCIHREGTCRIMELDVRTNFRRMAAIDTVLIGKDEAVLSLQ